MLSLSLSLALLTGCAFMDVDFTTTKDTASIEAEPVPLEDALCTLARFTENEGPSTKSSRRIESIETFFFTPPTKSNSSIPDAYIVNYEKSEGFAVLGANTAVSSIIAVTSDGSLCGEDLRKKVPALNEKELWDADNGEFYPVDGGRDFALLLIRCGLQRRNRSHTKSSEDVPKELFTTEPLTHLRWGQDPPFNTYCTAGGKKRLTGCSITALCQILATLREPGELYVDGNALSWEEMTCAPEVKLLSSRGREDVPKLLGATFNCTGKMFLNGGTAISAAGIRSTMKNDLAFPNVVNNSGFSYSDKLLALTSEMLSEGKPVFISAVLRLADISAGAHSWVVDGAKYSPDGEYLLHFNFGWEGLCNGYFSPSCVNPSMGDSYDSPTLQYDTPAKDKKFTWHFRLLSYDLPPSGTSVYLETAK